MIVKTSYIASNCNSVPTTLDWGHNNLICYAACNAILIYDPQVKPGGKVIQTLSGHKNRVNSLKWLSGPDTKYETELLSGSSDHTLRLWNIPFNKPPKVLLHSQNVNLVHGLYRGSNQSEAFIVSFSMDCEVKIWYRSTLDGEVLLQHVLTNDNKFCMAMSMTLWPETKQTLLALSLEDNSVVLLNLKEDGKNVEKLTTLKEDQSVVRSLDFTHFNGQLRLATAAQDNRIRLWRLDVSETNKPSLESVMFGHEDTIYSTKWFRDILVTISIDKTIIIWKKDLESGSWLEDAQLGAIGGNTLGFYGGTFSPDGKRLVAYSYQGGLHIWDLQEDGQTKIWTPSVTVGGHYGEVKNVVWDPEGQFLISVALDQTTRVHAPWANEDRDQVTWHEIARPQVHGHDMSSIAMIGRYTFASSAEEKVIRVFQAPNNFMENFCRICRIDIPDNNLEQHITAPQGASVPSLGLSNKAVFGDDNIEETTAIDSKNPYPEESRFVAAKLTEPPVEDVLLENTLWPEIKKLYGHGYEVYTLASSPDGQFLASACKSKLAKYAAILIWNTSTWTLIQSLQSHTLTVVQMEFSPDSKYLVSVSRDRKWSLFERTNDNNFQLATTSGGKQTTIHTRIIWCVSWSHDSKFFVTGSRDGLIVAWEVKQQEDGKVQVKSVGVENLKVSVTAVAFAPKFVWNNGEYLIAMGLEDGKIQLFSFLVERGFTFKEILGCDIAHHLAVNQLTFRPKLGRAGFKVTKEEEQYLQLASAGADNSVRIYDIAL